MPALKIEIDANEYLDRAASELAAAGAKPQADGSIHLPGGELVMLGVLPSGMKGGRPSVMIEAVLEDGSRVFLQTSLRLLFSGTAALAAKYGTADEQAMFVSGKDDFTIGFVPDGKVPVVMFLPANQVCPETHAPETRRHVYDAGDGVTRCSVCGLPCGFKVTAAAGSSEA